MGCYVSVRHLGWRDGMDRSRAWHRRRRDLRPDAASAVGAGFLLVGIWGALSALVRTTMDRIERAAGYEFFVTALIIASVSYGAQAWWLSALGLCAVMFGVALSIGKGAV